MARRKLTPPQVAEMYGINPLKVNEDIECLVEQLGGAARFRFPLRTLEQQTGLGRAALIRAKAGLNRRHMAWWIADNDDSGASLADMLIPNWEFRVILTPASPGRCYLDW